MEFAYEDPERAAAARRLGQTLDGRWKLEALLGVGGMGAVYAARDPQGNEAAVKVLHPEMSRRPDIRRRFFQEGALANRIGHPGVVTVLEGDRPGDGTAMLVMELLDGEPLSAAVERGLGLDQLLDYLDQILDVLAAAHDKQIVHRDLKPDNLFITRSGQIKVLDFGIARVLDDVPGSHKTRTGMTLGTVPFMAPEQALGKRDQIDGRADLFALGAMTFRILARRNIHVAETDTELLVAMATRAAPPLASVAPHLPADVCAVVDLAVAFSKEARYPDARTMQRDVRALRSAATPPHAGRIAAARDLPTNVEMVAPSSAAGPDAAPAPAVTVPAVPSPQAYSPSSAPTAAAPTAAPAAGAPPPTSVPTLAAPTVPGAPFPEPAPTVVAPAGASPTALRTVAAAAGGHPATAVSPVAPTPREATRAASGVSRRLALAVAAGVVLLGGSAAVLALGGGRTFARSAPPAAAGDPGREPAHASRAAEPPPGLTATSAAASIEPGATALGGDSLTPDTPRGTTSPVRPDEPAGAEAPPARAADPATDPEPMKVSEGAVEHGSVAAPAPPAAEQRETGGREEAKPAPEPTPGPTSGSKPAPEPAATSTEPAAEPARRAKHRDLLRGRGAGRGQPGPPEGKGRGKGR